MAQRNATFFHQNPPSLGAEITAQPVVEQAGDKKFPIFTCEDSLPSNKLDGVGPVDNRPSTD